MLSILVGHCLQATSSPLVRGEVTLLAGAWLSKSIFRLKKEPERNDLSALDDKMHSLSTTGLSKRTRLDS